ncbi:MAG: hypothetical protein AAGU74_13510 [Bacillota bacterium]
MEREEKKKIDPRQPEAKVDGWINDEKGTPSPSPGIQGPNTTGNRRGGPPVINPS